MSPQIIAVDELGLPEDFAAVADCARCGVSILGTIHAGSVLEVLHRLQMGGLDLIRSQMRLIGLQRKPDGRRILTVYEGGGCLLYTSNRKAQIVYERKDGTIDERPEELPFDINQDVIELTDADYAIWYMDAMENYKKYDRCV